METITKTFANTPTLAERAHNIRRNALRMGEVQGQGYIAQALDSGGQGVRLDVGQHHLHARFGKGPAERQPDAARPARHEGRLAGKLPHDLSPQSS